MVDDKEGSGPRRRCLFVIGSTGVGKTKLGAELARALDGEVVSADSMQVYKGFDIGSAKATEEEMLGVPHHLLDVCEASEEFSVAAFRTAALSVIEDIHNRGKLPVVVGGTMLYVQALLLPEAIVEAESGRKDAKEASKEDSVVLTAEDAYKRLQEVDPAMAEKLHPKDERRVRRMLEIFDTTGEPASVLQGRQKEQNAGSLRFDARLFWLDCDPAVHASRLSRRVDAMFRDGVVEEVRRLAACPGGAGGLVQGIGYKELLPLIDSPSADEEERAALVCECAATLVTATKQYATKQKRWIKNNFVAAKKWPVYLLDTSDVAKWDDLVFRPAAELARKWLSSPEARSEKFDASHPLAAASQCALVESAVASHTQPWLKRTCDKCGIVANGLQEWKAHLQSKQHRRGKPVYEQAVCKAASANSAATTPKRRFCDECGAAPVEGAEWEDHLESKRHKSALASGGDVE